MLFHEPPNELMFLQQDVCRTLKEVYANVASILKKFLQAFDRSGRALED